MYFFEANLSFLLEWALWSVLNGEPRLDAGHLTVQRIKDAIGAIAPKVNFIAFTEAITWFKMKVTCTFQLL